MARVLVTGMSGAGKSTLLDEMSRRGYEVIDTDHDGWTLLDGTWDEQRMAALLARRADVVVSGAVANQGRFYDRFDHVVLLSAPLCVLLDRAAKRSNNPYGKTAEQQAEIERYVGEVEPLLRRGATVELDSRRPVGELAEASWWRVREVTSPKRRLSGFGSSALDCRVASDCPPGPVPPVRAGLAPRTICL